eukprot:1962807-Amphidinium_carterae.1
MTWQSGPQAHGFPAQPSTVRCSLTCTKPTMQPKSLCNSGSSSVGKSGQSSARAAQAELRCVPTCKAYHPGSILQLRFSTTFWPRSMANACAGSPSKIQGWCHRPVQNRLQLGLTVRAAGMCSGLHRRSVDVSSWAQSLGRVTCTNPTTSCSDSRESEKTTLQSALLDR